ncbi:MAG: cytochrome c [Gammaproteobacteria bacterium]|nr:cytochrome c [Gammaproteobacteria bacterium]
MNGLVDAAELSGEQIYMQTCIVCHGDDGSGNMPGVPDLADNKQLLTEKDSVIVERIKAGIQSPGNLSMPARGGNPDLTDEQLLSVLVYVKQLIQE